MMRRMGARHRRRRLWRWIVVLLALGTVLEASAEPPPVKLPGRKTGSQEPWDIFLGRAAHTAIGMQYRAQYSGNTVFINNKTLAAILKEGSLGDPGRLSTLVRQLQPDITDVSTRMLFEIKPDNEEGREKGREQAGQ